MLAQCPEPHNGLQVLLDLANVRPKRVVTLELLGLTANQGNGSSSWWE